MIDRLDFIATEPPNVPVVKDGAVTFNERASAWLSYIKNIMFYEWNGVISKLNTFIGQLDSTIDGINLIDTRNKALESRLQISVDGGGDCCLNNNTITTTLSGSSKAVVGTEYTLNIIAISLWDNVAISSYIIDWGDGDSSASVSPLLTHTYNSGEIGETFTLAVHAIDEHGNRGETIYKVLTLSSMYIEPVIFTIDEDDEGKVGKNPTITIDTLPAVVGTSNVINKVILSVTRVSDNHVLPLVTTEDVTLPIALVSPDLEVSTEYSFSVKCRIDLDDLESTFSALVRNTEESFCNEDPDPFNDESLILCMLFNGDTQDLLGENSGVIYGEDTYVNSECGEIELLDNEDNNYVSFPTLSTAVTMSLWINTHLLADEGGKVLSSSDDIAKGAFFIGSSTGSIDGETVSFYAGGSNARIGTTFADDSDTIKNIIFVYRGSDNSSIYVNGDSVPMVYVDTQSNPLPFLDTLHLSLFSPSGSIKRLEFYNREIGNEEALNLYERGA